MERNKLKFGYLVLLAVCGGSLALEIHQTTSDDGAGKAPNKASHSSSLFRSTRELPDTSEIVLGSGSKMDLKNDVLSVHNHSIFMVFDNVAVLAIKKQCDYETLWSQRIDYDYSDPDIDADADAVDLSMELNGNLVVHGPNSSVFWDTNTTGNPGADLRLQKDGFLCVFKDGRCIWSNGYHAVSTACVFTSTSDPSTRRVSQNVPDPNGIIIRSGETKAPDSLDNLESPNRAFVLKFDSVHDLVVVQQYHGSIVWKQSVVGSGRRISMELDGNLVVYGNEPGPLEYIAWSSGTTGNPGAELRLENDGHLCVYKDGRCVWSNGVRIESEPLELKDPTASDVVLRPGQTRSQNHFVLHSTLRRVSLSFDAKRDVVIRKTCDDSVIWKQKISGFPTRVTMEANGNFVVQRYAFDVAWSTDTAGFPGADLRLQDDGHLCVYHNSRCVWSNGISSNTTCFGPGTSTTATVRTLTT